MLFLSFFLMESWHQKVKFAEEKGDTINYQINGNKNEGGRKYPVDTKQTIKALVKTGEIKAKKGCDQILLHQMVRQNKNFFYIS